MSKQGDKGCGAMDGWLSWIRPPHHEFFKTACVLHDELYLLGGSEEDRLRADKRLFDDMVRHSLSYFKGRSVTSQWWYISLALLYYYAVRAFGKRQFNYTQ